jgi:hypothetical protein
VDKSDLATCAVTPLGALTGRPAARIDGDRSGVAHVRASWSCRCRHLAGRRLLGRCAAGEFQHVGHQPREGGTTTTIIIIITTTIVAEPLNNIGINPQITWSTPQPST